ncbi:GntR family transcriptional regulator [Leifsonia sp. NPDC080035]|uniref:GntR family transcriptional regulator n=1 Tax=Leifsonia sp. NPDC080035 TaxID=3143936 RepID=A0AAU7G9P3_9MICO
MPSTSPIPEPAADRDAGAPRYARVAADLRRRIAEGDVAVGARLPSEAALAAEYGVTRSVVRGALAQLARQSLVVSRPRGGWVVQPRHRTQGFDRMLSFAQWAVDGGRVPGGAITSRERRPATAREAQLLRIRWQEPLIAFTRVRTLDGRRVMVERSTWAPWLTPVIEALPDDVVSTAEALAAEGIHITSGTHRIEAVAASTEDAALLGVRRSSPLLQVTRITTTREGRIVELGVDRYLSGAIAFEVAAGESQRTLV